MKASETTLRNLLEGTKQFQIPLFQRPYSWKKENWEILWGDLISLYNEEVEGSYKFFEGKLKTPDPDEEIPLDYVKFKAILLERLILVNITTDDKDNPYLIFESLNNKGEELTQADLVRNYIFMKLSPEEQEEVYKNEWLPLQESFRKNVEKKEYAEELTKAFWFYLRKDGEAVNEKEVYKFIKNRFDRSKVGVKDELAKLIQFTNYYLRLNFEDEEPESNLKRRFKRLMRLDFTTCHIFLLNIYHEYDEERLSLGDFEKILLYLESYFVRRRLAGVSTKVLGTVFNNLYKQVKEKNTHDLVNGLGEVLAGFEGSQIWPDDESFRQGIINEPLYSKSSTANDRVKFLLETVEESLSKERVDPQNLTIEHIMPQKLNNEWGSMLGANPGNAHKKWLHTLGNLTLTGYNTELSNKPFKEKLILLRSSNISLNQYFDNVDVWNEEAIKKRAEVLADKAIKLWPRY